MIILLILYLIFVLLYIIFNIYGIFRISSMRIQGDKTGTIIVFYAFAISAILFVSFVLIASLDWSTGFSLLGNGV